MFAAATRGARWLSGASAIAGRKRAGSAMAITEAAKHEVGGLGTEGERCLARPQTRPQLRKGEPDGSRSSVSQPIGGDDDPLRGPGKPRGQEWLPAATGLRRANGVGPPPPDALPR